MVFFDSSFENQQWQLMDLPQNKGVWGNGRITPRILSVARMG
jgi:hypothetical protein